MSDKPLKIHLALGQEIVVWAVCRTHGNDSLLAGPTINEVRKVEFGDAYCLRGGKECKDNWHFEVEIYT